MDGEDGAAGTDADVRMEKMLQWVQMLSVRKKKMVQMLSVGMEKMVQWVQMLSGNRRFRKS